MPAIRNTQIGPIPMNTDITPGSLYRAWGTGIFIVIATMPHDSWDDADWAVVLSPVGFIPNAFPVFADDRSRGYAL